MTIPIFPASFSLLVYILETSKGTLLSGDLTVVVRNGENFKNGCRYVIEEKLDQGGTPTRSGSQDLVYPMTFG